MPATLPAQQQLSFDNACRCAKLAHDFRGQNVVVIDVTAVTQIVDYFVIATFTNPRAQTAMLEELRLMMKTRKQRPLATEGAESQSSWQLQDYGDIVVHAFLPEARTLYDLEGLWADGQRVDWQAHVAQLGE